jgi:hypothetical protein
MAHELLDIVPAGSLSFQKPELMRARVNDLHQQDSLLLILENFR